MNELENRSLDRGIQVLEVLGREGSCALRDLHAHTGIPKSSLRRLLGTLEARRLVRRGLSDGRYRTNVILPACAGYPITARDSEIVDTALPILSELTRQVKWPSDLHVWDNFHMRILDSTRALSPFSFFEGVADLRINIFGSASGIACLSTLSNAKITELIEQAAPYADLCLTRYATTEEKFFEHIQTSRKEGYGCRLPMFFKEIQPNDGLSALAVPLMNGASPVGAITLLWPLSFMSIQQFAATYLEKIQLAAQTFKTRFESL